MPFRCFDLLKWKLRATFKVFLNNGSCTNMCCLQRTEKSIKFVAQSEIIWEFILKLFQSQSDGNLPEFIGQACCGLGGRVKADDCWPSWHRLSRCIRRRRTESMRSKTGGCRGPLHGWRMFWSVLTGCFNAFLDGLCRSDAPADWLHCLLAVQSEQRKSV